MTYSIDAESLEGILDFFEFKKVPGWVRQVLVVWPHTEALIAKLREYGCTVTIVVGSRDEHTRLSAIPEWAQWITDNKLIIVFGDPLSYVAAVSPQKFAAVFIPDSVDFSIWQHVARRAMIWNGRLNCVFKRSNSERGEAAAVSKLGGYFHSTLAGADNNNYRVRSFEKSIGWMIMSYPRCGTHMMVSALKQHPDLMCYAEVFNPATSAGSHRLDTVQQVLESRWGSQDTGITVHSSIDRPGYNMNMLDSMRGYKDFWKIIPDYTPTILLTRSNMLARYVSQLVAMRTGIWNSRDPDNQNNVYASVYVNINEFVADMKYVQDCWDNAAAYFKHSLSVEYEDMVNDFDGTMHKVQEYLQVPYSPVAPETVKLAVSMEEVVENYVQVRAWCRRNKLDHFLLETLTGV